MVGRVVLTRVAHLLVDVVFVGQLQVANRAEVLVSDEYVVDHPLHHAFREPELVSAEGGFFSQHFVVTTLE